MVCLSRPQEFLSICYDEQDRHGLFTLPITFSMGSHYDLGQCRLARKGSRFLASFETYCQFTSSRIAPAFCVGSAQGSRVFSTLFPTGAQTSSCCFPGILWHWSTLAISVWPADPRATLTLTLVALSLIKKTLSSEPSIWPQPLCSRTISKIFVMYC